MYPHGEFTLKILLLLLLHLPRPQQIPDILVHAIVDKILQMLLQQLEVTIARFPMEHFSR